MTTSAPSSQTSFTSAVAGSAVTCTVALIAVSGTFSGTVKFKWTDNQGTTHIVQENGADLAFTAAGERVVDFGVPVSLYAECTSYSSGTAVATIQYSPYSYGH